MNPAARLFLVLLGVGGLPLAMVQADDDPALVLAAAQKATRNAPVWRVRGTYTDFTTKETVELLVERVAPDHYHARVTKDGKLGSEIVADGKKICASDAGAKFKEFAYTPDNASEAKIDGTLNGYTSGLTPDSSKVRVLGHETVDGVPATAFERTSDLVPDVLRMVDRVWVSDRDHRLVKMVSEEWSESTIGPRTATGFKTDTRREFHYDYDPNIKITSPVR